MKDITVPMDVDKVDFRRVKQALEEMKKKVVDVKIINIHWGNEFELYPDPSLMRLGRKLIEMGFDIVMGNHPHVLQPSEICFVNEPQRYDEGCHLKTADGNRRKGIIYYSLGNFATAMFSTLTQIGAIQQLTFVRRGNRVEWFNPRHRLVVNPLPSEVASGRERVGLILEEELGNTVCFMDGEVSSKELMDRIDRNCRRFRIHLKYLNNHLTGREDESLTWRVKNWGVIF